MREIEAVFLVSDNEEINSLHKTEEALDLFLRYEYSANFEFLSLPSLVELILNSQVNLRQNQFKKSLEDGSEIFHFNGNFVKKLVAQSEEQTNEVAYLWREKFWSPTGRMQGLGIWSHLFCLKRVCEIVIRENKHLYVWKSKQ